MVQTPQARCFIPLLQSGMWVHLRNTAHFALVPRPPVANRWGGERDSPAKDSGVKPSSLHLQLGLRRQTRAYDAQAPRVYGTGQPLEPPRLPVTAPRHTGLWVIAGGEGSVRRHGLLLFHITRFNLLLRLIACGVNIQKWELFRNELGFHKEEVQPRGASTWMPDCPAQSSVPRPSLCMTAAKLTVATAPSAPTCQCCRGAAREAGRAQGARAGLGRPGAPGGTEQPAQSAPGTAGALPCLCIQLISATRGKSGSP